MHRTRCLATALRGSCFKGVIRKMTPARARKKDCTGETQDLVAGGRRRQPFKGGGQPSGLLTAGPGLSSLWNRK